MKSVLLFILCYSGVTGNILAQTLAFPGAEGGGRYATGGRGGFVYHVTKLTDDGTSGTFRYGINLTGARTMVFDVSGNIELSSNLSIKTGDITIAGQTAPGDGICIKNYPVNIDADNIIIRYIRFRPGDEATAEGDTTREYDAAWGRYQNTIIIDHCSFSWANDEVCSFYHNTDFTLQWCIISESFYLSTHWKGAHGYGGIWGGYNATFHHNLLAHHSSRNPRFSGARGDGSVETVDFRNNVIYNWGYNSSYGGETGRRNMINNYYKKGPATRTGTVSYRIIQPSDTIGQLPVYSKWYVTGNYVDGNTTVTDDNWAGGVQPSKSAIPTDSFKVSEPFIDAPVTTQTAIEAYNTVLQDAGCNLPKRDTVDARIIDETKNGIVHFGGAYGSDKGIIDSQTTVGGYPVLNTTSPPLDTDQDGMPDSWEEYKGLDSNDASDRNEDQDNDGFTNLEEYLNAIVDGSISDIQTSAKVDELIKASDMTIEIYPVPVTENSVIRFNNPKSREIKIMLYDICGNAMATIADSVFPAGETNVQLFNSPISSGMYILNISMENNIIARKIVVP